MLHGGLKDEQIRDSGNQKVHPQPMEEPINQNPKALEALISKIFASVSSLKTAYIQLQAAHTPYDPEKIQAADKLVITELKLLSELKHLYRENNPSIFRVSSPPDSSVVAEMQEQQSLLKTYEMIVKKFQSEIESKDSEIVQLQQRIEAANQKRTKMEKNLLVRGVSAKKSEASLSLSPSTELFVATASSTYSAIHEFAKPLVNMMKAAGWDLDAAANSIEQNVVYAKRSHKKYAFESFICEKMFSGFEDESFSVGSDMTALFSKEEFFQQFVSLKEARSLDVLGQNPDSIFGEFCRNKYLLLIHPKMEASFFGNLDQRSFVAAGGHPRTAFYQSFLKLAKSVWLLHRLANSFDPHFQIFACKNRMEFSELYMENVQQEEDGMVLDGDAQKLCVGLMVMPGFIMEEMVFRSHVYLLWRDHGLVE